MSSKLRPGGDVYSPEQYHLYFKKKFLGATDYRLPDKSVITIPNSSADLAVDEFSDFMSQVEAEAADHGCYLDE